ncbi:MAG: NAD(P)-dependent oxidoreductase [Verrucomicrobia bacterium]|nr:NAD(P)-dependent oxidoreductase [Verrucomicrobiota bacterium]
MKATPESPGPRSCIVLGAKGFVGRAIADEGRNRGYEVVEVDIDNYDGCVGASADILINANGNSKKYLAKEDPTLEFDLSVRSVMRSLFDFSVKQYVHLSTIDVYSERTDPAENSEEAVIDIARLDPYGLHKYMAESLVQQYAPSWLVLRMGGFVGPGLRKNSIYDLLKKLPLRVHPDSEYQYLHTEELARIVFDLVEAGKEGEIFNAAGDGTASLRAVADEIPDCELKLFSEDVAKEKYEVNIGKIKSFRPIPGTEDTVRRFIRDVIDGKESLA